jgi:hypothetical protein
LISILVTSVYADAIKETCKDHGAGFLKEAHPELSQQIMLLKKHDPEKSLGDLSDVLGTGTKQLAQVSA